VFAVLSPAPQQAASGAKKMLNAVQEFALHLPWWDNWSAAVEDVDLD
jgi:hypothetical protein